MSHKNPRTSPANAPAAVAVPPIPANSEQNATFSDRLLTAMLSFRDGDFNVRMPNNLLGVDGKIADAFNEIVSFSDCRAKETVRVSKVVGKEGRLRERMNVPG